MSAWTNDDLLLAFNYGELYYVISYSYPEITVRKMHKKNKRIFVDKKHLHRKIVEMEGRLDIQPGRILFYTKKDATMTVISADIIIDE